jgi:hypothetical protein
MSQIDVLQVRLEFDCIQELEIVLAGFIGKDHLEWISFVLNYEDGIRNGLVKQGFPVLKLLVIQIKVYVYLFILPLLEIEE